MPTPSSSAEPSVFLTKGEQMAYLESEYAKFADLLASLPVGPDLTAASDAIRDVSDRMDEVMGVTPEYRRAEAQADFEFYACASNVSDTV